MIAAIIFAAVLVALAKLTETDVVRDWIADRARNYRRNLPAPAPRPNAGHHAACYCNDCDLDREMYWVES